jgi:hypothetical protein
MRYSNVQLSLEVTEFSLSIMNVVFYGDWPELGAIWYSDLHCLWRRQRLAFDYTECCLQLRLAWARSLYSSRTYNCLWMWQSLTLNYTECCLQWWLAWTRSFMVVERTTVFRGESVSIWTIINFVFYDDWPELGAHMVFECTTVFGCDRAQIWTIIMSFVVTGLSSELMW